MRKNICIASVIFLLVLVFFGCSDISSPASGNYDNRPIVCLGDSLTEGYGASKPHEIDKSKSYPAYLQSRVKVQVVNAGITGDTAAGGLARVDKDVLAKNPQMIIISLGANDFFQSRPAKDTKADLKAIINKVKSGNRKIYLASFIGDADWEASYLQFIPDTVAPGMLALLNEYKRIYSELIAENPNVGFIPNIWKGIQGGDMSDPIHPNSEGYKKMAENILNEIALYLKSNNLLK